MIRSAKSRIVRRLAVSTLARAMPHETGVPSVWLVHESENAAGQPDSLLRRPGPTRRLAGGLVAGTSHRVTISPVESSLDEGPGHVPGRAIPARGYQWAELMRRTFGLDVLACPRCGGRWASWP